MPDTHLDDTWYRRELPVLREAARIIENNDVGAGARASEIASATGLAGEEVVRALRALSDDALIDVIWNMPASRAARVTNISGEARRLVGQWPSPENLLARITSALETIAGTGGPDAAAAEQAIQSIQAVSNQLLPAITTTLGNPT